MDKESDALEAVLYEESQHRMQMALAIVGEGGPLNCDQLDQLHQEFDTLFGGARAVHMPELEHYFRSMASYSRFLRNCLLQDLLVTDQDWRRLFDGIRLGWQGDGEFYNFLWVCTQTGQYLLEDIAKRIHSDDAL